MIDDVVHIFEKMEEKGCASNTMAYNAMISNSILVGDLDNCIQYYKGTSEKNCVPDIHTYNRLISAFLKVRRVVDALEMFGKMWVLTDIAVLYVRARSLASSNCRRSKCL